MGRYINYKDEFVWKYRLGVQDSEMHRISTEFGIGEYHMIQCVNDAVNLESEYVSEGQIGVDVVEDILILTRDDIRKLEAQIQLLKKSDTLNGDEWFVPMTEAIRDFMVKRKEQDKFIFEGQF